MHVSRDEMAVRKWAGIKVTFKSRTGPSLGVDETMSWRLLHKVSRLRRGDPFAMRSTCGRSPRHTTCENRVLPLDIDDSSSFHRVGQTATSVFGLLIQNEFGSDDD